MQLTAAEYRTFLRQDLYTFIERCFYELNPDTRFLPNWHIELIASELEACRRGETKRLILNLTPRGLKSHCATVAFPAFLLGHNPSAQIICASYAQDLANKHAMDCRSILNSDWYQRVFPTTRLSAQRQAVQEFVTTRKGFRLATSVGGVLTGRGADFVIIDDPLKPDEALSDTQRASVNQWYDNTLYSRLNNKSTGCIIIVMQRLHEADLVGHVMTQGEWRVISLPAIAEQEENHMIHTPFGIRKVQRLVGQPLHPERESLEVLQDLRETLGEYNFAGQYQQAPAPLGGGLVKLGWFKRYTPGEEPSEFELIVQSWDTANKATELSDYSVCTTWGLKNKNLYLLDVARWRYEYPELKRAVHDWADAYKPRNILIEDRASGTQLVQELQREGLQGVTRYEPKMDKIMRLHSVTSTIESGLVHVPTEAEWLNEYLHELTTFPNGKHDDQADSTSQALDWIKTGCFANGLSQYYEREAIRMGLPASAAYQTERCFLDDARLERLTRAAQPRIFQWRS